MQPYVIKQGDFLARLAYRFGFDADTVWNDPKNAPLRQLRPNPNILWPTDILYIPDPPANPVTHDLVTGGSNTFTADVPTIDVTVKFADQSLASQAYSVRELPDLPSATSGADGTVSFPAPLTLGTATIVFTEPGATFVYQLGNLDPIETLSGVFQRLQHLGFIDASARVGLATVESVRWALLAFKAAQADQNSPPAAASAPPSTPAPLSGPPPSPPSSPAGNDMSPGSGGSDDDSGPVSAPPDSSPSLPDNGGLNDDGTLDDDTKQLLLSAHGA
jgi:hypothetical protein